MVVLTSVELAEIAGFVRYINDYVRSVRPEDITLIDSNGEPCAVIGCDEDGSGDVVLKKVY